MGGVAKGEKSALIDFSPFVVRLAAHVTNR